MDIIKQLNWRYATKSFDSTRKLTQNQLDLLLDATILTPSSYGLQPYQILVVEDNELRKQLQKAAWNQPQLTEASQVLIFAAKSNISEETIDAFINDVATTRQLPLSALDEYRQMMKGSILALSENDRLQWASKQCYIALGQLLTTCAIENIDACPMEGFEKDTFDQILGLDDKNLKSTVMATIGYRNTGDAYQHLAKVRKKKEDIIINY